MAFKNKIKGFSLIELIVWITISLLLMVSVWVFVTSWMQNIFIQQKSMQNVSNLNDFVSLLYDYFGHISPDKNILFWDNKLIFKSKKNDDIWWFTYIWLESLENFFCKESSNNETNHIFIKNFIPFVEVWENLENLYDIYESKYVLVWDKEYKSLQKEHVIVDKNWDIVVWRNVYWINFQDWEKAKKVYLNSPTWLATDWKNLFISDTLNNRILYLNDNDEVYTLLEEKDWIEEATWLYFDKDEKSLYISNSWRGEILKLSSNRVVIPKIITFINKEELSSVWSIKLWFYRDWEKFDLDKSIKLNFSEHEKHDIEIIENYLLYEFKKEIIQSWAVIGEENTTFNFEANVEYQLRLENLLDFEKPWVYSYEIELWANIIEWYFFTQWDEDLTTKNDNSLEVVRKEWLSYPSWIWWKGENDFYDISLSNLESFNLKYEQDYDFILNTPIDSLELTKESDLLNIILKYYKNYDCNYVEESKNQINTFLYKINLK